MSINDRNRYAFSYKNHDAGYKNFLNKNFNKSTSCHSSFKHSKFTNSSFVGTKFKFCNLFSSTFDECLIRGALFIKSNLTSVQFSNSLLSATFFDKVKMNNCIFINCKIIGCSGITLKNSGARLINTEILSAYPPEKEFNSNLIKLIHSLRNHDFIRKSTVLHRKRGLLDTASIKILVEEFGEEFLLINLLKAANKISREFHTLSYIKKILHEI